MTSAAPPAPLARDIRVDLYSDTNTRPSPPMRQFMAQADCGNEQAGEDPTTNALQDMVAELLGKEAAVFLPSGTMCNEIAYRVWCRPGDEIILDETGHAIHHETGGPAALTGAMCRGVPGELGIFTADQLRAAVRPTAVRHAPRSRVVNVEQTSNGGGGKVWPLNRIQEVTEAARELRLKCHMDGARLLNAVVASGTSAADFAAPFDSVWIDFSKGLGCPVGAVLAGDAEFIEEAFRCKHQFGGAMRQSGIIAAACVYALEHNVERLADDHANAARLADGLGNIDGIALQNPTIETNIVYFDVEGTGRTARAIHEALLEHGVRIGAMGAYRMRAVTHLDVDPHGIDTALRAMETVLAG